MSHTAAAATGAPTGREDTITDPIYTVLMKMKQEVVRVAEVLGDWMRFFQSGMELKRFTKRLYQHLTLHDRARGGAFRRSARRPRTRRPPENLVRAASALRAGSIPRSFEGP